MSERSTVLLEHHLKELKLPTFLREYGKVAGQCAAEDVDHPGYLLRLSELELIDRHHRMVDRRIKAARFPATKSLDTFDFLAMPSVNKHLVMQLARCEYVDRRENVIAVGNSGTGKTHMALGLGLAACQRGLSVGFTTAASLVNELNEARDERRLLNLQKKLARIKLLIIDELGFVPLSKTGAELLFEVFSQRYERGSVLVTTNLPFDEWTEVFGSERLTGALLDRLTHRVHILEMNGESYRLRQSRQAVTTRSASGSPDAYTPPHSLPLRDPDDARRRRTFSLNIAAQVVHFCSAPCRWPKITPPLTIVQNSQRVAASSGKGEVAFEVHLPQVVGCLVFKSLPGTVLGPLGGVNAAMTTQDRRDSTGGRHVRLKHIPAVQKPPSQLTSSPGRMCRTGRQHRLLNLRWGTCRRVVRPPRQLDQACLAPFTETPKPLVSSRRADPEATAKAPFVGAFSLRQLHELSPLRHNGHLLPWHDHLLVMKSCLLWCPPCPRTCVSYVPGLYTPPEGGAPLDSPIG